MLKEADTVNLEEYKACICEGAAEEAIMNILLDNDLLIFQREELLEQKIIRCRKGQNFEFKYLRKDFDKKISVIRILDSKKEDFRIGKAYRDKVNVINVITAPEIEMLIIFNENKFDDFKKKRKKPSDYCKQDLRMSKVKSYDFVKKYFSNPDVLIQSIKKYNEMSKVKENEVTLLHLLNSTAIKNIIC